MKTILKGVLTVCAAVLLLFPVRAAAAEVGQPEDNNVSADAVGSNIASGTVEGITWVIDAEGKLTITGTGDLPEEYRGGDYDSVNSAYHSKMPWAAYDGQITSAKIDVSGMTNTSWLFCACVNMTSVDLSGFDTSQATDMSFMFEDCNSLTSLDVSGFNTSQVTNMKAMFDGCSSLTSLDVSNFDTSQVADMVVMFYGCSGLTSLDVSGFDTSQVRDMRSMFEGCSCLMNLDISNFNTSQVTNMGTMFAGCSGLTSLNISGFDTNQVTDMNYMFSGCSSLTSLDISGFDTSQVTNMAAMFSGCSGLTSLDVSGFDTSQVTDMRFMFDGCSGLTSLDVSGFNTSQVTNMCLMFYGCSGLTSLDVSGFDTSQVTDMYSMFYGCSGLTSLDVSGFDTSQVTDMYSMFYGCSGLTSLDISGFDTSQVTDMGEMFYDCSSLTSLGVRGFNTSQVTNMCLMFYGCSGLTSLDVSGFDTSQVTNMSSMFDDCSGLTSLDVSGFDTSKVKNMEFMFSGCNSLTDLEVNGFDTSQVTDMSLMFQACSSLTSLNLNSFDTSQVTDMFGMFNICSSLTSLDMSSFNTSQVTDMGVMFENCNSLKSLDVSNFDTSQVTNMSRMFRYCYNLMSMDISGFDISQVTDMETIFENCLSLTSLNTPLNVQVSALLPEVDGLSWHMPDGTVVTELPQNLDYSVLLTRDETDNIASGTVEGITWVIDAAGKLTITGTGDLPEEYRGLGSYDPEKDVIHSQMPWAAYDGQITSAKIDVRGMTDASYLFLGCYNMTSVDVSDFSTSQITNMEDMFFGCSSLTSLDVSGFDTSQVTNMTNMFTNCSSLTSLDVSGFDTSKATSMIGMFSGCSGLTSLDVSGFDTNQVTSLAGMFSDCSNLTSIDVSGFGTSQVTYMQLMFSNCSSLTSLDVNGLDTSQVTNMIGMFEGCSGLTSLDLSGFDMSQVTLADYDNEDRRQYMLSACSSLTSLNTPLNVQVSALLPEVEGLSWHMPDGTVVTELPKNLDYSVLLTRDLAVPEITTTTADLNMDDVIRVKYVPYSYTVETSNTDSENMVTFSIVEGRLAEGLQMYPATGEIYGVPTEAGEFPITVMASYSNEAYSPSYAEIMLIVLENTAENIAKATEPGYEITQPVTDFSLEGMSGEGTQTLVSQGEYAQFKDVYLDGRKLIANEEYTSEAGSTRITIRNQTLGDAGVGMHTLGIEFRTEEGTLKRAAQNYTVSQTSAGSESEGQPETSESESQPENNESESQPEANESENQPESQPSVTPSPANNNSSGDNSDNAAGTQAVTAEAQMTEVIYTVQPGDSLWKIAAKYRRQGVTWQRIYADNRAVIRNPGLIFAGQQLRICFIATQGTETSAAGTLGTYSEKYSVRQGDTLWGIAVKTYGDGRLWTRIYEANRDVLENPNRLRIGQLLTLGQ